MKGDTSSPAATAALDDPPAAARRAGLRYMNDGTEGITRQRDGDAFRYLGPDGTVIDDEATLARIQSLAIPPAWTDVWICELDNGHLQATGRDAKQRKQYRYHSRWRSLRDEVKYERMINFGKVLPDIRRRVDDALRKPDGTILEALRIRTEQELVEDLPALQPDEAAVVALLQQRLHNAVPAASKPKRRAASRAAA